MGSQGWPAHLLYDPRRFSPLGFILLHYPVKRMPAPANDEVCPPSGPPPTVRKLDDLSVRRAEREFLRS
jgi:hypothetical protein